MVLTSPDCLLCADALGSLAELGREFPLRVREIEMTSPEGRRLVAAHRPAMPPAVIVRGELFSVGRLPRKKLRRLLERAA